MTTQYSGIFIPMSGLMKRNVVLLAVSLAVCGVMGAAPKRPKPVLYVPMDYSTCGYRASEQPLPDVGVAVCVEWQEGDCSGLIQRAIDYVTASQLIATK